MNINKVSTTLLARRHRIPKCLCFAADVTVFHVLLFNGTLGDQLYLKMYWTDLHQTFPHGVHLATIEKSCYAVFLKIPM